MGAGHLSKNPHKMVKASKCDGPKKRKRVVERDLINNMLGGLGASSAGYETNKLKCEKT